MSGLGPLTPEERVKLEIGPAFSCAKVSGYWVIGRTQGGKGWERVSPAPLRSSLERAIADARKALGL